MVASDDRLPHQIFTKGKMNNAIKKLSSTLSNYEQKVSFRKQVVVTIEISTFSNHRNVFCSNYWNL